MNIKFLTISKHKRKVWVEVFWNTVLGFIVSYAATIVLGPYIVGVEFTHEISFTWTLVMTIISGIRGYVVRLYYSRKKYIAELRKELRDLRRTKRKGK